MSGNRNAPVNIQEQNKIMLESFILLAEALGLSASLASLFQNAVKRRRRKRQARVLQKALLACGMLAVVLWAGRNG